jgi:hypothetical protein
MLNPKTWLLINLADSLSEDSEDMTDREVAELNETVREALQELRLLVEVDLVKWRHFLEREEIKRIELQPTI